jgi:hypothetical protein
MGNNVSKVLQDQYLRLCSLKVDINKQQLLLELLLENLKLAEKKLACDLIPDAKLLPSYDQKVLESCSDKTNLELIDSLSLIGEYPRIKLAADTIDFAFDQISKDKKIPVLLKLIIMSLKPSLFRLALEDYKTLVSDTNPILQTIDILISYVPLWKDEQKVNFPTFKKLVSLLDFIETSPNELAQKLEHTVQPIAQIKANQQKRSLIFEKRLVEREASSAITRTSQLFVNEILEQIKKRYILEPFLSSFIEQHWQRLLSLEFVRHDKIAFINSILLLVRLIRSLAEINSKQALDHLIDELPELKQGLLAGFNKLATSEIEANEFLTEVESRHLIIIQENSQLSYDDTSAATDNQDAPQASTDSNQSTIINEDDLIRLKPTDFYDQGISSESNSSNSDTNDNLAIHQSLSSPTTGGDNSPEHPVSIDSMSFLEAIEDHLESTSKPERPATTLHEALFEKFHLEFSQLIFPNQGTYDSEETHNYIALNDWYSIRDDRELHKLIYIDPNSQQHVFANQMAQKSYSFRIEEINQLYTDNQLIKFVAPNIIAPAIKNSLQLFKEFISIRNKNNNRKSADVIKILAQDTDANLKNKQPPEAQETNNISQHTQPNDPPETADISSITVGSWISYDLNNREIKCKLAARIVSKDLYIFVDRRGLKILEQTTQELTDKLSSGKVTLLETENTGRLESVIAKTRNLKS